MLASAWRLRKAWMWASLLGWAFRSMLWLWERQACPHRKPAWQVHYVLMRLQLALILAACASHSAGGQILCIAHMAEPLRRPHTIMHMHHLQSWDVSILPHHLDQAQAHQHNYTCHVVGRLPNCTGMYNTMVANRVSSFFDWKGPSLTVVSFCWPRRYKDCMRTTPVACRCCEGANAAVLHPLFCFVPYL